MTGMISSNELIRNVKRAWLRSSRHGFALSGRAGVSWKEENSDPIKRTVYTAAATAAIPPITTAKMIPLSPALIATKPVGTHVMQNATSEANSTAITPVIAPPKLP